MKEQLFWVSKTKLLLGCVKITFVTKKSIKAHFAFTSKYTCSVSMHLTLYSNSVYFDKCKQRLLSKVKKKQKTNKHVNIQTKLLYCVNQL